MKIIYFFEAVKNISKNITSSLLLILCFLILFILFGEVSVQSVFSEKAGENAEKISLTEYTKIDMIPFTSLSPTRQISALYNYDDEDILAAGRAMDTIITTLRNKYCARENKMVRQIYMPGDHVQEARYCSYDLYEVCSSVLVIKEGKWFDKEDFNRTEQIKKGYVAPVLIGASFAEKYGLSVGDVFVADMFYDGETRRYIDEEGYKDGQTYTWRVIGIFEKDSSFFYRSQIIPANSKVLLPDYYIPTLDGVIEANNGEINDNVLDYIGGSLFTLFRTTDFYIKRDGMQQAVSEVNEEINKSDFISQCYIAKESGDTLTMAAQNQKKASDFYNTAAILTYVLSAFGIIMSVNNKIQNNKRNYAIHSLNGASVSDLIMFSVTEITILMLIADAFFFAFPYRLYFYRVNMGNAVYVGRETPLFVLGINIITLIITVAVSFAVLGKFDIVENLKNKE